MGCGVTEGRQLRLLTADSAPRDDWERSVIVIVPPSLLSDFDAHRLRRLLDRATDVLGQTLSTLSRQLVASAVAAPGLDTWARAQSIVVNHAYGTTLRMAALDNTDFTAASDAPSRSQILIALDLGTQPH